MNGSPAASYRNKEIFTMTGSTTEPGQVSAKPSTPEAGAVKPHQRATRTTKPAGKRKTPAARAGTKTAKILRLLQRPHGASLAELRKATGWQAHSVRGFLSGAVKGKMRLKITALKREDGKRAYRVAS
jgi:hypothetical protein